MKIIVDPAERGSMVGKTSRDKAQNLGNSSAEEIDKLISDVIDNQHLVLNSDLTLRIVAALTDMKRNLKDQG